MKTETPPPTGQDTSLPNPADAPYREPASNASNSVRVWLAVLFLFSGAMLIWYANRRSATLAGSASEKLPPSATASPPQDALTEFTMFDQMANKFSSSSLRGKYWLASFFFTSCPSVCPALNSKIQELQREYAESGLEFVSITCDPTNDTSTQLYEYSKRFSANPEVWHFLTAEMPYITRVAKDLFQVSVSGVTHSDRLILMDKEGHVVDTYRSRDPVEFANLKRKLKRVLESEPRDPAPPASPGES